MDGERSKETSPFDHELWGHGVSLLERIAQHLPPNIVVQLHNNGEPLLYPRLCEAIALFKGQITSFDTNGKLLLKKQTRLSASLILWQFQSLKMTPKPMSNTTP